MYLCVLVVNSGKTKRGIFQTYENSKLSTLPAKTLMVVIDVKNWKQSFEKNYTIQHNSR